MVVLQTSSLWRVVGVLVKGVAITVLMVVTALVILFLALDAWSHKQTEQRISDALAIHYAPAAVDVIERQNWKFGSRDFSFGGQICFEINVSNASGKPDHRVAMVADGDDGGAFEFSREYDSFSQCTADFFRG